MSNGDTAAKPHALCDLPPFGVLTDPGREFRWLGRVLIPGIFDGEHYFILEAVDPTSTKLIDGERFSGILVSLMRGVVAKTGVGFEMMNKALKLVAETTTVARVTE